MKLWIARRLRVAATALETVADAIDPLQQARTRPVITSEALVATDDQLVTDAVVHVTVAETSSGSAERKSAPLDMNVGDDSRLEWAVLFLDWLYDNAPCYDQLTGEQLQELAKEFNNWARVKGPPIGPYMFRFTKKVGIVATAPVRDQKTYYPGCRRRHRLYALPPIETARDEIPPIQ